MDELINGVSLLTEFTLLLQDQSRDAGMVTSVETDRLLADTKVVLAKTLAKDRNKNKKLKAMLKDMSKSVSAITPANILVKTPRGERKTLTLSALVPVIMTTDKRLMKTLEDLIPDQFVLDDLNLQQQEAYHLVQNVINVVSYEQELANKMILYMTGNLAGINGNEDVEMYQLMEQYDSVAKSMERYVKDAAHHSKDLLHVSPTKITDVNRSMFLNTFSLFPNIFKFSNKGNIGGGVKGAIKGVFTRTSRATSGAVMAFGLLSGLVFAVAAASAGKAAYENIRVAQGRRYQAQVRSLRLLKVELENAGKPSSKLNKEISLVNEEIRSLGNKLRRLGANT